MRIALMSDTHGILPPYQWFHTNKIDAVIHAGDIGPDHRVSDWCYEIFSPWLRRLNRPFYATFGNHDFSEQWPNEIGSLFPDNDSRIIVNGSVEIDGKRVWFSPWTPKFFDWAWMKTEKELWKYYNSIPDDVDVMVSHGPPHMIGDQTSERWTGEKEHVGSRSLNKWLTSHASPSIVICGHIHHGRGVYRTQMGWEDYPKDLTLYNCALLDDWYQPTWEPMILEDWKYV